MKTPLVLPWERIPRLDSGVRIRIRCTSVAWIPERDGAFVAAHADGNLYVYEKSKDGPGDSTFPVIKDQTQFTVAHARSSKNGQARLFMD
nr:hypothetical protein [Tanacetum cinerariifolium]